MPTELRNFLALSYDELEELNLKAKEQRKNRVASHKVQEDRLKYLTDEKRIKAVTVLFSDLEGRLHMLDYDKKFLINSWDNLTFDGSSIRGFTAQRESDLRLGIDWGAFYCAPSDVFGFRSEVPDQQLGQPHLRRIVHPRLHCAARQRSAPGHRLGRVLLGSVGCLRFPIGSS